MPLFRIETSEQAKKHACSFRVSAQVDNKAEGMRTAFIPNWRWHCHTWAAQRKSERAPFIQMGNLKESWQQSSSPAEVQGSLLLKIMHQRVTGYLQKNTFSENAGFMHLWVTILSYNIQINIRRIKDLTWKTSCDIAWQRKYSCSPTQLKIAWAILCSISSPPWGQ